MLHRRWVDRRQPRQLEGASLLGEGAATNLQYSIDEAAESFGQRVLIDNLRAPDIQARDVAGQKACHETTSREAQRVLQTQECLFQVSSHED